MKKRQDDYEAFVAKFERKRTSDDCYTPPEVYDIVRGWLGEQASPRSYAPFGRIRITAKWNIPTGASWWTTRRFRFSPRSYGGI